MTFSFSNTELLVGNKLADDNTVKVSSDRVQPLTLIKCEESQMPHLNKCHRGLFHIEQLQFRCWPLDVTVCFSAAAVRRLS